MNHLLRRIYTKVALLLTAAGLLLAGGCELPKQTSIPDGALSAVFLDVGQADASLLTLPDGRHILIDGGNNNDGALICDYIRKQGIDTIDYLIATHPHEDHIGGLDDVVDSFSIGKIYMPKVADSDLPTTRTYEDFLQAVSGKGYKIYRAKAGGVLLDEAGVRAEFLSPAGETYDGLNDYSAVLRISYGQTHMLFTGDAEALCEREMLEAGYELSADLLKVGHHGSDTSSTAAFINAVDPDYAVISCGADNTYGHPSPKTLDTLSEAGAQVYRTDQQGTVTALSDGKGLTVTNDDALCCDGGR